MEKELIEGVTFVAVCHNEIYDIDMFCSSLLLQKDNRWSAIICCNGHNPHIQDRMNRYLDDDTRFTFVSSVTNTGAWGCYNRINALQSINTEYVVNTSIQDYYLPNAVGEILTRQGNDIIYWDCLHNHKQWDILSSKLEVCGIDWGSFAVKSAVAKKVGINYPNDITADGKFIADIIAAGYTNNYKIEKILTVHN